MLSYQHGYHAGNRADVLKHAVLHALLSANPSGSKRSLYVETHSGRGVYDLTGKQATKGGEAVDGILPMLDSKVPSPLRPWTDFVRQRGVKAYPGSPALAQSLLEPDDRIILFEKHPAEYEALSAAMTGDPRVQVKKADGYSSALKLAPRGNEHLICFVDPSYETQRDIDALALWTPRALKRWPTATLILWLPLFLDGRETEFGEFLTTLDDCIVAGARWPTDPAKETALEGSAIVAYRAPEAVRDTCLQIADSLNNWWAGMTKL